MKIGILGSGAMGSVFGAYLAKDNEVCMIDISQNQVDEINKNGLCIENIDGTIVKARPKAFVDPKEVGPVDLLMIFVKSNQTYDALKGSLALVDDNTLVLTVQNGYGNADDILKLIPRERVIVGTTRQGANTKSPGYVYRVGNGVTHIGVLIADQTNAQKAGKVLEGAGFKVEVTANVMEFVWKKVLHNCTINPVTAILDVLNEHIVDDAYANAAAKSVLYEAVAVANAADGLNFNPEEIFASICEKTNRKHHSSMLVDVTNKRRTEITRLNGALVKKAKELNIAVPVNEFLCNLIMAKEDSYLK